MQAQLKQQTTLNPLANYQLGRTIGSGSFAKVKLAIHIATGIEVAIKIISKAKIQQLDMQSKVDREISIMQMFQHPHVIKLYEVIQTQTDIYLVQELAENGELFQYIVQRKSIDEEQARHYFQQLVAAVDYLHRSVTISHRDLKSENTMINKYNNLKVTDFGLSNIMLEGDFLKTSCGSPNYAAPEVIAGQQYLGCPADVWSTGCLLYTLLVGKLPFDDPFVPTLFRKIRSGDYIIPETVPPLAADLIRGMLQVQVDRRFTIEMVVQHPWFQVNLPDHLRIQFDQGYEAQFGLVDETYVLNQTNQYMNTNFNVDKMQELLKTERTKNVNCVTYRLIYDREYEKSIQKLHELPSQIHEFTGVTYETFAKQQQDDNLSKHAFFFGQKLCAVSEKLPHEVMVDILKTCETQGFKWRMGNIVAYKYYDETQKKDLITLRLENTKTKNPFQFCLRIIQPANYLEYEMIIGCCLYIAPDAKRQQQYILDLRKVTGEVTMFQYQAARLADVILESISNNLKTNQISKQE
ncbi:Kinase, CAMK CAMKL [Spironucleus salmonicida]|uniref:Kinase, CAMK CAMKL n=1 Tax=Spironucleus salmonicida TaxID=348837 RepID=V6LET2_9EUKA|nr:Kinase, CAMK CAMKL [Spironucleus salmonicida]|eukprot:EST42181.1 Kinase, CAMK CAMKL [Spironucleus salmonicida]